MEFPEFAAVETIGSNCNKLGGLAESQHYIPF